MILERIKRMHKFLKDRELDELVYGIFLALVIFWFYKEFNIMNLGLPLTDDSGRPLYK